MTRFVSFGLILLRQHGISGRATSKATTGATVRPAKSRLQVRMGTVGLAAFPMVVHATRAQLIQPRFSFVQGLLETRRDPTILAAVEGRDASCLAGERAARFCMGPRLLSSRGDHRLKMGPIAGQRLEELPRICGPDWPSVIVRRDDAGSVGDPYRPRDPR
jgi:hypothetical protein